MSCTSQNHRRVLIIITGGTICMRPADSKGIEFSGLSCAPLEQYLRAQPEMQDEALPHFDIHEWDHLIDSSDVTEADWARMVMDIELNYDKYDGFVVLHGTDSLAFTASALAFMLEDLAKPVIVTGSMLPMSHIHTDARKNVTVSTLVAGFSNVPEVLVVFGSRIIRGCRTSKVQCTTVDAFDSPNCHVIGNVGIDVTINQQMLLPRPASKRPLRVFTDMKPSSVVALTVTPAFNPVLIRHIAAQPQRPLGIILELFGTGTAPTGHPAFMDAAKFAIASGVTIVAVTQCVKGTCSLRTYANGQALHDMGVIEGKDLTVEAAFCKLAYLFGKEYDGMELRHLMEIDLRGELSEQVSKITGQAILKPTPQVPHTLSAPAFSEVCEDGLITTGMDTAGDGDSSECSVFESRRHPIEGGEEIHAQEETSYPQCVELVQGVTLYQPDSHSAECAHLNVHRLGHGNRPESSSALVEMEKKFFASARPPRMRT